MVLLSSASVKIRRVTRQEEMAEAFHPTMPSISPLRPGAEAIHPIMRKI